MQTADGLITIHKDRAEMDKQAVSQLNEIRVAYSEVTIESRCEQLGFSLTEVSTEEEVERGQE